MLNKRTDDYGGSFENRIRFAVEVIGAIRGKIPDNMPLSFRISATDWMEHTGEASWTIEESIRFAKLLPDLGVDILDVSSGGGIGDPRQKIPSSDPRYQIDLAGTIKADLQKSNTDVLIAAVGHINSPQRARDVVQSRSSIPPGDCDKEFTATEADLAFIGKQFLWEPEFVLKTARDLGVEVTHSRQLNKGGTSYVKKT